MGYNWNPSVTAGVTMLIPPGGEFGATFVVVPRVRMDSELRTRIEVPVPVWVGAGVIVPSPVVGVGPSVAVGRTRMDCVDVESARNKCQYGALLGRELGGTIAEVVPLRMSPSTS